MSVIVFFTILYFQKTRQKRRSPNIFLCFFRKNIEKVWDIEKCWHSFSEFGYVIKIFYVQNFF